MHATGGEVLHNPVLENADHDNMGGSFSDFYYHVQGHGVSSTSVNLLQAGFIGIDILDVTVPYDCPDLAGRLMSAISQVKNNDVGDERCIRENGSSATTAFLHIDNPDGSTYIHLEIIGDGTSEPVTELEEKYLGWRSLNPCAVDESCTRVDADADTCCVESRVTDSFLCSLFL